MCGDEESVAQRQILIVDNDPIVALVTARGLQRLLAPNVHVTTMSSAGDARLHCLRETIDLLIIDPNPQSQATTALITMLHTNHPAVAVLVLTAYDTPRLRKQMQALGVEHYVAKPLELHQLAAAVCALLGMPSVLSDGQPILYQPADVGG
jgi:DNA-binding NarL/FixJ family response regulator